MEYVIEKAQETDGRQIVDIFNHFVCTSFAAYPERDVGLEFFIMLRRITEGFPFLVIKVRDEGERELVGFGLMRPYHSYATFKHTGILTYFILPEHTRLGLGSRLLTSLVQEAKARSMTNLLAEISSKNEQSLNFHTKHGFVECGRIVNVGRKFNQYFDVVWMQKLL
jgi:L-amino acid N-acyltransferase YncA